MLCNNTALKFLISGALNTSVSYALYLLLIITGITYELSLGGAYILGILLGFKLNRRWTFSVRANRVQFCKYLFTMLLVFLSNLIILKLLVSYTPFEPKLGQLVALSLVTVSVSYTHLTLPTIYSV